MGRSRKNRKPVPKPVDPPVEGPVRSCIGCGRRDAQERLIRFIRPAAEGEMIGRNLHGRGFYLHRSEECLRSLEKRAGRWFNAAEIERIVEALSRKIGAAGEAREGDGGVETLIRFALRTGRFVAGPTGARVAAHRKRAGILLLANDMDPKRADEARNWAREIPLPVRSPLSGAAMAGLTGREKCDVLFVYDRGLAKSLVKRLGRKDEIR